MHTTFSSLSQNPFLFKQKLNCIFMDYQCLKLNTFADERDKTAITSGFYFLTVTKFLKRLFKQKC